MTADIAVRSLQPKHQWGVDVAYDEANIAENKDSVLDRTRRLFYVCCSRALKDLAVVLFVPDVAVARAAVVAEGLFPEAAVRGVEDLA